jgi:acid phosphatase type 7
MKRFSHWLSLLVVVFVLHPAVVRAQAEVTGVYLTWRDDPSTTTTTNRVSLSAEAADTVWYRRADDEWTKIEGTRVPLKPSGLWVRRVQLSGLEPDTRYEIFIGTKSPQGDTKRDVYHFRTMPRELKRPLSFVTGGDMMHTPGFRVARRRSGLRR